MAQEGQQMLGQEHRTHAVDLKVAQQGFWFEVAETFFWLQVPIVEETNAVNDQVQFWDLNADVRYGLGYLPFVRNIQGYRAQSLGILLYQRH